MSTDNAELTDDTAAKRSKLFDTSSSKFSSPNLHDSSGGIGDPETRESAADMEISVIEALTNVKFEVDRALGEENKTLHRLLDEIPLESEAVTKAAELNSIRDKRVHSEVHENEADAKIISCTWVLKPLKARYVLRLRGRRGRRRFRKHDNEMLLSQATDFRNEGYTVFTADVKPPSSTHT